MPSDLRLHLAWPVKAGVRADPPTAPPSTATALRDLRLLRPSPAIFDEGAFRRIDGIEALTVLVEQHGIESVHSWLTNIATSQGKDLPCRREP